MKYDLAALARAKGMRRQALVLRPILPRLSAEQELYRIVIGVVGEMGRHRDAILAAGQSDRSRLTLDALSLGAVMQALRASFSQALDLAEGRLSALLSKEARRRDERWIDQVNRVIGIDLTAVIAQPTIAPTIDLAVQANVALIRGLSDEVAKRIETQVIALTTRGASNREMAKALADTAGFAKARAKLIAVDQAAKFNGALNMIRQREAGVDQYEWSTVKDQRVRPLHKAREGSRFRWDSPPSDGHPGQPVRCRCVAAPVLDLEAPRRRSARARREGAAAVARELGMAP